MTDDKARKQRVEAEKTRRDSVAQLCTEGERLLREGATRADVAKKFLTRKEPVELVADSLCLLVDLDPARRQA